MLGWCSEMNANVNVTMKMKTKRGRGGEIWHQLKKNKFAIVGLARCRHCPSDCNIWAAHCPPIRMIHRI